MRKTSPYDVYQDSISDCNDDVVLCLAGRSKVVEVENAVNGVEIGSDLRPQNRVFPHKTPRCSWHISEVIEYRHVTYKQKESRVTKQSLSGKM